MTRYKGQSKTNLIERDFPHHVEMIVAEGGLGRRLDAMYEWVAVLIFSLDGDSSPFIGAYAP